MYNAQGKIKNGEMVEQYLPLVRREALLVKGKVSESVELDDLIQSGSIGLLGAIERFDPTLGIAFPVFARTRIRGAMYDELRSNSWIPRTVLKSIRDLENATVHLSKTLGRKPEETEIALEMGIEPSALRKILLTACPGGILSIDDIGVNLVERLAVDHFTSSLDLLIEDCNWGSVVEAISKLNAREQQVMAMHYQEEMNLKEIGAVLGVSESRVSQIHGQALASIRKFLGNSGG